MQRTNRRAAVAASLICVCILGALAASALSAAGSSLHRPDDPIVLQQTLPASTGAAEGGGVLNPIPAALRGIDPSDLVAFHWDAGWHQVPVQVDEREMMDINRIYGPGYPSCSDPCYTKPPNGAVHLEYNDPTTWVGADTDPTLDANDEVALRSTDAGGKTTSPYAPAGVDPASAEEVKVTDPLDATSEGYVYLFKDASGLDPAAGASDIDYHFALADGKSYKDATGEYKVTGTAAPSMARGPRPENSYVQTADYRRDFKDRWVDNDLKITRGSATGVDILDRHDGQFDNADASCVRDQDTYKVGEGAFVTNHTGPVRAIRDFIGANSGPHVQRRHTFYDSKEVIDTYLRVHPVPGIATFNDYSAAATGMKYSDGVEGLGAVNSDLTIDATPDAYTPFLGSSSTDGWQTVNGPQGGLAMPQAFVTNNPDPTYHGNYRDGNVLNQNLCTGDDNELYGASGPQASSAINNTDEAARNTYGGGQFAYLYYLESLYYKAPGQANGPASLAQQQNPLQAAITPISLTTKPPNMSPVASFTFTPSTPTTSDNVAFDGSGSTDDGSIAGYAWDFGDGGTATVAMPHHTFASMGTYTVTLTVTDNEGATDVATQSVEVETGTPINHSPVADFTYAPLFPATGEEVDFDGSGSDDDDGTIASYAWTFGDGGTATVQKPSHAFAASGDYTVTLTVTDNLGATDTSTETVHVADPPNAPPVASFTYTPASPTVGETVHVDGSGSTDSDGTIASSSYAWDLDDDGQYDDASGAQAARSFATPGFYNVGLEVTDDDGATSTANRSIKVTPPAASNPGSNAGSGPLTAVKAKGCSKKKRRHGSRRCRRKPRHH